MATSQTELHQWVIKRVAEYCRCKVGDIDPDASFTQYGMDSVYALALVGDIEDRLEQPVIATAIWDYPTVNKLVEFVQSLLVVNRDTAKPVEVGGV
jgi:acyl carrier protein